jgi:hypothetical protein
VGSPVAPTSAVLQPTSDGVVTALAPDTGHRIWEGSVADSAIFGLAASSDLIIAAHTGSSPGVAALETDATATLEDVASPTAADPGGLVLLWLAAAVPITGLLLLTGRRLGARGGGTPLLAPADDDEPLDPWESDLEDDR